MAHDASRVGYGTTHRLIVNRKRKQRLRRLLAIETLYPKRNLSLTNQKHKIYPYLLKGLDINRPNQVWATDVTYLPMAKGFIYLVAVMVWYARRVLSWRVSTTLDTSFCVEALEEAIEQYGCPEIFNTDQGSQFTSDDFTELLKNWEGVVHGRPLTRSAGAICPKSHRDPTYRRATACRSEAPPR